MKAVIEQNKNIRFLWQHIKEERYLCIRKTDKKNSRREQIWAFCNEAKSASEILELLGLKNKENLMENYLNPMLEAGMLAMTEPETPTNRNQKYKAVNPKA